MRFAYAHFPINVSVSEDAKTVEIRNFLGEKLIRRVPIREGVKANRYQAFLSVGSCPCQNKFYCAKMRPKGQLEEKNGFFSTSLYGPFSEEFFVKHSHLIEMELPFPGFPLLILSKIWATTTPPLLCFMRLMVNWDWRELFCLNSAPPKWPPFVSSWPHTESFKRGGSLVLIFSSSFVFFQASLRPSQKIQPSFCFFSSEVFFSR